MKSLISLSVVLSIAAVTLGQNPFEGLLNPPLDGAKTAVGTSPGLGGDIVPIGSMVQPIPLGGLVNPSSDAAKAVAGSSPGLVVDSAPVESVMKQNPLGGEMNSASSGAKALSGSSGGRGGGSVPPMGSFMKQLDGIKGQPGSPEKMWQKSQANTGRSTGQYQKKGPYQKQMYGQDSQRAYRNKDSGMTYQGWKTTGH